MNHNINWATYVFRMKISRRNIFLLIPVVQPSTSGCWVTLGHRCRTLLVLMCQIFLMGNRSGSAGRTIQAHKPYVDDATLLLSVQNEPEPVIGWSCCTWSLSCFFLCGRFLLRLTSSVSKTLAWRWTPVLSCVRSGVGGCCCRESEVPHIKSVCIVWRYPLLPMLVIDGVFMDPPPSPPRPAVDEGVWAWTPSFDPELFIKSDAGRKVNNIYRRESRWPREEIWEKKELEKRGHLLVGNATVSGEGWPPAGHTHTGKIRNRPWSPSLNCTVKPGGVHIFEWRLLKI